MNTDKSKAVAYAWSRYYSEVNRNMELHKKYCEVVKDLNNQLPPHLVEGIKELYNLIKKEIECPICMDVINNDTLKITSCGHKYCNGCYDKIDNCSLCRKKIFKKK